MKRTPLLIKVVFLYVLTFASFAGWHQLKQEPLPPTTQVAYATPSDTVVAVPLLYGKPARLQIKRLGIDLPILPGRYQTESNTWELSNDNVHYALTSHLPNNKYGNTVLYGHNRNDVLGKTNGLRTYDELVITTTNGRKFTYVYMDDAKVNPTNTQVFAEGAKSSRVTLLTCSGAWNQERRLMVFEFSEVD